MRWLTALVRFWKSEELNKEAEKTRKTIEEAKQAICETRAMLDGEDFWLVPQGRCGRGDQNT